MKFEKFVKPSETFNVGFIGGSITEGSGSTEYSKCYAARVVSALNEKYPETEFKCICAGVGGTGSDLGLFRLQRDLLDKKPDAVFIEFALNDHWLTSSGTFVENMIRRIKLYNSNIPIILLYTVSMEVLLPVYLEGKIPQAVEQHMKLSEYYGIPQINIGWRLFEKCGKDKEKAAGCFIPDGVHPNDKGHEYYAETIMEELSEAEFTDFDFNKPYLYKRIIRNPHFIMGNTFANEEWKLSFNNMWGRLENYIYSFNKGDELEFEFEGSILGIYYTVEKDSGIMEYSIDGGEWKQRSLWDFYALQCSRATFTLLEENLEDTVHTLKIRNPMLKDEKSEGYYIRIGAFAVG